MTGTAIEIAAPLIVSAIVALWVWLRNKRRKAKRNRTIVDGLRRAAVEVVAIAQAVNNAKEAEAILAATIARYGASSDEAKAASERHAWAMQAVRDVLEVAKQAKG